MNDDLDITPTGCLVMVQEAVANALDRALQRRADEFPGLAEFIQEHVVVQVSLAGPKHQLGVFCSRTLRVHGNDVCELRISLNQIVRLVEVSERAEQVLDTGLHEAGHAWAHMQHIRDTSRGGRYHNSRFGRITSALGLQVIAVPRIGLTTVGLQPWARREYADALMEITQALVFDAPRPSLVSPQQTGAGGDAAVESPTAGTPALPMHVAAACACADRPRRLRMAAGSWVIGPVHCPICRTDFQQVLSGPRQDDSPHLALSDVPLPTGGGS